MVRGFGVGSREFPYILVEKPLGFREIIELYRDGGKELRNSHEGVCRYVGHGSWSGPAILI